jgi:hypothetical protein
MELAAATASASASEETVVATAAAAAAAAAAGATAATVATVATATADILSTGFTYNETIESLIPQPKLLVETEIMESMEMILQKLEFQITNSEDDIQMNNESQRQIIQQRMMLEHQELVIYGTSAEREFFCTSVRVCGTSGASTANESTSTENRSTSTVQNFLHQSFRKTNHK